MTSEELVRKYFVKENGYQPLDAVASDHFSLGCLFVAEGKIDLGLKMISGALSMAKCTGKQDTDRIKNYVKKNSINAGFVARPHHEVVKELEALQAAIKKAQEKK